MLITYLEDMSTSVRFDKYYDLNLRVCSHTVLGFADDFSIAVTAKSIGLLEFDLENNKLQI